LSLKFVGRVGFDCKMYVVQYKKYNADEKLEAVTKYQLQAICCYLTTLHLKL